MFTLLIILLACALFYTLWKDEPGFQLIVAALLVLLLYPFIEPKMQKKKRRGA